MSGLMNMVSRFARGRTTAAPTGTRRPAATRGVGGAGRGVGTRRGRGGAASLEGTARRLLRRTR